MGGQMRVEDLPIITESLLLRQFVPEDAAAALLLSNEQGFREWLPSQVYADEAEARSVLESLISQYIAPANPRLGPYVLAIEHRVDRQLIGHVGFSPIDQDVEIGFAIAERYQRRGLAIEAILAGSRWAFDKFELPRILAITRQTNQASRRALERAGFEHEEDRIMRFQGTQEPVSVYALSR
jgi:RimJ/RimL family protein N-acetyltransferase